MIGQTQALVVSRQILNERGTRHDSKHLHATAQTQHRHVVVEAIGHRQVFRHVAGGISAIVALDAMPCLGYSKQCGTDVATTQENHGLDVSHQLGGIGAMVGVALDNIGILLAQNANLIDISGAQCQAIVLKSRRAQLRQNHRLAPSSLDGKDNALIGGIVGLPRKAHAYLHTITRHCRERKAPRQQHNHPIFHHTIPHHIT